MNRGAFLYVNQLRKYIATARYDANALHNKYGIFNKEASLLILKKRITIIPTSINKAIATIADNPNNFKRKKTILHEKFTASCIM